MSDPTIPGELSAIEQRMGRTEEAAKAIERRMTRLEGGLEENTQSTARVEKNTAEIVEFFESMQGAFRLFNLLGQIAKPVGYIAAAIAAVVSIYTAWKSGIPHIGPK